MNEPNEQRAQSSKTESSAIGKLFYWLAAAQILQIGGGAVLGLFVAPTSLFVSRTENEALAWVVAAMVGFAFIALGVLVFALSIVAASAFRREWERRKSIGAIAAGLAILSFPLGLIFGVFLLQKIFQKPFTR